MLNSHDASNPLWKRVYGLTGGIACGKSTVGAILRNRGCYVLEQDVVSRIVAEPGSEGLAAVIQVFGAEYQNEDGSLARRKLSNLVFGDVGELRKLERIIGPRIISTSIVMLSEALESGTYHHVFYESATIFEHCQSGWFKGVVVLHCSPEEQMRRLMARNTFTEAEARDRISKQLPLTAKVAYGEALGYAINTECSMEELEASVGRFLAAIH